MSKSTLDNSYNMCQSAFDNSESFKNKFQAERVLWFTLCRYLENTKLLEVKTLNNILTKSVGTKRMISDIAIYGSSQNLSNFLIRIYNFIFVGFY